jgi:hypothetical protein
MKQSLDKVLKNIIFTENAIEVPCYVARRYGLLISTSHDKILINA